MTDNTRSRAWCFTSFNFSVAPVDALKDWQYLIYGRETTQTGRPHDQGYVYFKNARTLKSLKKMMPECHFEVRKGSHAQARDYCKKDRNWADFGVEPDRPGGSSQEERAQRNKRLRDTDIRELVDSGEIAIQDVKRLKQARDILATEGESYDHTEVRGIWFYGPPGTGKSHTARTEFGDVFYVKAQNKWFDGYQGEETIVLDDLDKFGACLGHYLKIWADKYRCSGEIKGGTVPLRHKRFIVTSNYMPEELWSDDREMQVAIERRFQFRKFSVKYI